jgi:hypothetical protein
MILVCDDCGMSVTIATTDPVPDVAALHQAHKCRPVKDLFPDVALFEDLSDD